MSRPAHSILNKKFAWVPSGATDIRKSRLKWLRDYARDWDAAHTENAFRNMVPVNLTVLTVKKVAK